MAILRRPRPGPIQAWLAALVLLPLAPRAARSEPRPPKLVVLVVADQMRADYLERFRPYFRGGGLERLLEEGLVFSEAHHEHATTYTGPGHAVLGSGIYASSSGIVGNDWFDRLRNRSVYCVDDPESSPPYSAASFTARSLAERVKARYPSARVVGVSLKDRAAILMVGPGADAAYWLRGDGFTTSSAYRPLAAALDFNARIPAFLESHGAWTFSISSPAASVCPDDVPTAHGDSKTGPAFPHEVKSLAAAFQAPAGNELLERFAEGVVSSYGLGANPSGDPDVLAVSFSATDYIGHIYGPESCEAADTYARLDAELGRWLEFLDKRVGRANLVLAFSSDHGVAPIPAVALKKGLDAGGLEFENRPARTIGELARGRRALEKAAAERFGYTLADGDPASRALVKSFEEPSLYIDTEAAAERGVEPSALSAWLEGYLRGLPGVEAVYTAKDIGRAAAPFRRVFRADRSGDVLIFLKPNWIFSESGYGAVHGQYQPYDTHVPLILWGRFKPAIVRRRVAAAQVAPTFARLLGLSLEGLADPLPETGLSPLRRPKRR